MSEGLIILGSIAAIAGGTYLFVYVFMFCLEELTKDE
jgi:hypothetical protein